MEKMSKRVCKTRCKHRPRDGHCPYRKCVHPPRVKKMKEKRRKSINYLKFQNKYIEEIKLQKILDKGENLWTEQWLMTILNSAVDDKIRELKSEKETEKQKWDKVKQEVLARSQYRCEECKSKRNLTYHYIDFSIGRPMREKLKVLCRKCHWKKHLEECKKEDKGIE